MIGYKIFLPSYRAISIIQAFPGNQLALITGTHDIGFTVAIFVKKIVSTIIIQHTFSCSAIAVRSLKKTLTFNQSPFHCLPTISLAIFSKSRLDFFRISPQVKTGLSSRKAVSGNFSFFSIWFLLRGTLSHRTEDNVLLGTFIFSY